MNQKTIEVLVNVESIRLTKVTDAITHIEVIGTCLPTADSPINYQSDLRMEYDVNLSIDKVRQKFEEDGRFEIEVHE